MIITIDDTSRIKYCRKGTRAFCKKYGIDYRRFLKEGIPHEELLSLNDSMANKLVEETLKANKNGK